MRIEGNIVEAAVGKECHATEEDYHAREYGDRQEYDPVADKTALLRRLRKVKSLDTIMFFV